MRRILFIGLVLVCFTANADAQMSKEEAISNFVQGNLSYKEGDFARSIEMYEGIIKAGKASGNLYYNLANAYYRHGDLGKAILNYERAKRVLPRDGDINFNYKYVLSKVNLYEGEIGRSWLAGAIKGHVDFYSVDEMFRGILLLVFILGTLHLGGLYGRWPKPIVKPAFVVAACLLCIFIGGLLIKMKAQEGRAAVIKSSEAKFEPKESSTTHYKLLEGEMIKVLKEDGSWMKIERSDGKLGWLSRENLEKI